MCRLKKTKISILEVYSHLLKKYGKQGWWPLLKENDGVWVSSYEISNLTRKKSEEELFEICIGAILTQNTNWQNAEKALINLKKEGLLNFETLSKLTLDEIARYIRPSGYFNQKSRKIIEFLKLYKNEKNPTREQLMSVWGLGSETVDDMLLYAFDKPIFVIDAYTKRIFSRLGFCDEKISYGSLQKMIQEKIPKDLVIYKQFHALIVEHGKKYCRKKPICQGCFLEDICKGKYLC